MLSRDFLGFVEYVTENYRGAKKIVEVGVGRFPKVAIEIKRALPSTEVVVVDSNPETISEIKCIFPALRAVQDDVQKPNVQMYAGADLIYSIRPPLELWSHLIDVSKYSHSDLIIKPLHDELPSVAPEFQLVNFRNSSFLLRKNR